MCLSIKRFWRDIRVARVPAPPTEELFREQFEANLRECSWKPHPRYSVFTQYDQEWYLAHHEPFMHKYLCFYAVSKTIMPRRMIELGACAGASGDAYLSAARDADYIGLDVFGVNPRHDDGTAWDPHQIAEELFNDRGFKKWQLIKRNLRTLDRLPSGHRTFGQKLCGLFYKGFEEVDLVIVDAAHDFDNEYADLQLALTANPEFIFVDDADDETAAKPAIEKFLTEDLRDRVAYTFAVNYIGGGLVIRIQNPRG